MMKLRFSNHAMIDRIERITFIGTNVGFGEIVSTKPTGENREVCLTDTGVLLIRSVITQEIVTVYLAGIDAIAWMFGGVENEIKRRVKKVVIYNMNKGYVEIAKNMKK